jgi:Creatinase/Prolidase N-terminal domain
VLLVSTLDDIDWLLNLRGNDIAYNPVFISYMLFHPDLSGSNAHKASLFID